MPELYIISLLYGYLPPTLLHIYVVHRNWEGDMHCTARAGKLYSMTTLAMLGSGS